LQRIPKNADGDSLATASFDGAVRFWDVSAWRRRSILKGHAGSAHAEAFLPDGKTLDRRNDVQLQAARALC
jgi:WD40 repeat protein